MSSPKQSRLAGALSLVIAQAVVLVLGYVTHLWIGRVLGPAPYGIYGVVLALQSIIGLLLTLGVPVAISRFVARDEAHAHSILAQGIRIQTVIALLVALTTLILSPLFASLLGDASLTNYIRFIALIIFLQAYYPIFVQFLSGMHRFNRQALLTICYAAAKLIGALSLIYIFGVYGAFAGFAVGGVVAAVVGWLWTWPSSEQAHRQLPYKAFLQFAGTYVLILVGLQLLISLDLFMVKALLKNDVLAGYYNAAVTLSRISYMLLQALAFILLPSVSALTRPGKSHTDAAQFIAEAIRYLIALIVPSVVLAATTSRALVTLFYSHSYLPAAPVLTVLIVGIGSLAFYLLLTNIVAGAGKARVGLILTVGLLIASAGLGFILIPQYGLMGAAWQTTSVGLLGLAILGAYTFKAFAIHFPLRSTINILIATAVSAVPTSLWQTEPLTLLPQYILAGALYVAVLLVLQEISPTDRQRLSSLHPRLHWLAAKISS
ncbi:MAG: oligosaccharide flippase family protein [Candidatus Andersenbacteria bacterium]